MQCLHVQEQECRLVCSTYISSNTNVGRYVAPTFLLMQKQIGSTYIFKTQMQVGMQYLHFQEHECRQVCSAYISSKTSVGRKYLPDQNGKKCSGMFGNDYYIPICLFANMWPHSLSLLIYFRSFLANNKSKHPSCTRQNLNSQPIDNVSPSLTIRPGSQCNTEILVWCNQVCFVEIKHSDQMLRDV